MAVTFKNPDGITVRAALRIPPSGFSAVREPEPVQTKLEPVPIRTLFAIAEPLVVAEMAGPISTGEAAGLLMTSYWKRTIEALPVKGKSVPSKGL